MKFASTLKNLREQNSVTQQELADYLKVTRSTIAGYETKGKQPDYERLLRIAGFFHVSADYLLTGFDSKTLVDSNSRPTADKSRKILTSYSCLSSKYKIQAEEYLEFLKAQDTKHKKASC